VNPTSSMSLLLSKASRLLFNHGQNKTAKLLEKATVNMLGPVANLTNYPGNEAPRYKPWPYEKYGFRFWHMPFDRFDWRYDDNTKIIVIDGNIATGKTNIGKQIAEHFDMLYVPDVSDEEMFWWETSHTFDAREHDHLLPMEARSVDFQTFYSQKGFPTVLKNFPRTQYMLFRYKMMKYCQLVMAHVLNTGQGVVMNRGMWSDCVWAETMHATGYMSRKALQLYNEQYQDIKWHFWHPHLVIYLDTPIDQIKENIKKRNIPWEVNSPVINDEWLIAMENAYKQRYLPKMRQKSEVLEVDMSDRLFDIETLFEKLENLDLEWPPEEYPDRFYDWHYNKSHNFLKHNRLMNLKRYQSSMNNQFKLDEILDFLPPAECPEMCLLAHDYNVYKKVVQEDPRIQDKRSERNPLFTFGTPMPWPCSKAPRKAR